MAGAVVFAADGVPRCPWSSGTPGYVAYHDTEWGFPVADDTRLFEKLCLEGFQSGLSWRTILEKREGFRAAFAGFDIDTVAEFGEADVERMLGDASIVRHRGKIEASISNARRAQELIAERGSLAAYLWDYEITGDEVPEPQSVTTAPTAIALSKDLKKRGWKFVGPTTAFAFIQSMGLINDHVEGCVIRDEVAAARRAFAVPR